MLTFILLVVLGGGVGLLVVSLAESSKPTADGPPDQRAEPRSEPAPDPGSEVPPAPPEVADPPEVEPAPAPAPAPEPALEPAWELVPVGAAAEPAPELPRRRRTSEAVPRSQVALEGRFADVARVPLWRRLVAVVGIVTISVLSGVLIAAVLAAAIGAAAELVNTAIG